MLLFSSHFARRRRHQQQLERGDETRRRCYVGRCFGAGPGETIGTRETRGGGWKEFAYVLDEGDSR